MHVRSLFAALAFASIAVHTTHAGAQSASMRYSDPYAYFTTDAQYEAWYSLRAGLEIDFDEICGDTFCEGDYSNITPLRFQCSVQQASGRIGHCVWSFAASNEDIDPRNGDVAVQAPAWSCSIALAPQVTIDALLAALAGDSPLHAPLPGSGSSIYDALADCL